MMTTLPPIRSALPSDLKAGARVIFQSRFGGAMFNATVIGGPTLDDADESPVWDVHTDHAGDRWGYLWQFYVEEPKQQEAA